MPPGTTPHLPCPHLRTNELTRFPSDRDRESGRAALVRSQQDSHPLSLVTEHNSPTPAFDFKLRQAAIFPAAIFRDSTSWRSLQPRGETFRIEETQKATTLGLAPPAPRREPFFHEITWKYLHYSFRNRPALVPPLSSWVSDESDRVRSRCPAPEGFSQTIPEQKSLSLATKSGAKHAQE